ncbi:hypothetical protein E9232_007164 [Inquilinus ginsengisoli]|uniref:GmrSD restriction endonucleases N-terminal domain-containing protein n=1 Tax=Inquilinus ginsengisoli TaxID=363840 RepID=A0ABU1K164_9PROT|nr:DUF262 domain-containing protein [Inquilinus ginsengisoli]MDR6294609.1 hypothetical protein [Inquilinus ginsengisoli]
MKTSAENRRVRALLSSLQSGELIPQPDFQRKLVWSNKDKIAFLDTVLQGYPFPEIYIAVGEVNLETAAGTEILVDGQQRITTLHQYFTASAALRLPPEIRPYRNLTPTEQTEFMNYEVAVRNLGIISTDEIREVFRRINSTSYSLNAMEIHNARYRGPLKQCADDISQDGFFDTHKIFSAREIRRMNDVIYSLTIIISMLSTYFHRNEELEPFLDRYNDDFPEDQEIRNRFLSARDFIKSCTFPPRSRAWKKTDLLVLFVEIDRLLNKEKHPLDAKSVGPAIENFYEQVEKEMAQPSGDEDLQTYFKTTVQATNDRSSRVNRGKVIRKVILAA